MGWQGNMSSEQRFAGFISLFVSFFEVKVRDIDKAFIDFLACPRNVLDVQPRCEGCSMLMLLMN